MQGGLLETWVKETAEELGREDKQLSWLEDEIVRAFGRGG
jgi:hypothetical protein